MNIKIKFAFLYFLGIFYRAEIRHSFKSLLSAHRIITVNENLKDDECRIHIVVKRGIILTNFIPPIVLKLSDLGLNLKHFTNGSCYFFGKKIFVVIKKTVGQIWYIPENLLLQILPKGKVRLKNGAIEYLQATKNSKIHKLGEVQEEMPKNPIIGEEWIETPYFYASDKEYCV